MQTIQQKITDAVRRCAGEEGVGRLSNTTDASWLSALQAAGLGQEQTAGVVAEVMDIPYVQTLADRPASATFVEKIPIAFAREHGLLGLAGEDDRLTVAISDLGALDQLEVVSRYLGRPTTPIMTPASAILTAINLAYQQRIGQADQFIDKLDRAAVLDEVGQLESREDLLDVAGRAPVIKLVNLILFEAVKELASDVHLQPYEDRLVVRFRIDGMLFDAFTLPKALTEEAVSRVKVMGRMNIAEKRLPQDGRATVQVGDRIIDLRIASLPTSYGERIVLRLLDKSARLYTLEELGMPGQTLSRFRDLIGVEHGLVLVTGPTGSGKSTTLYAALNEINSKQRNVITLEDPIEYQLPGVSQSQISGKKGMTFASGLRSVLRQDPDIIMVGEIRDHETAVMAIQSALTGHLVFSTLHTNDAASAVTRLLDLGIEPYLVGSSVIGVLAQRLVRRVCRACQQPYHPTDDELARIDLKRSDFGDTQLRRGPGCPQCRQTGYRERVGIFELLVVQDAIRKHIQDHATASQIKTAAIQTGMHTLRDDGVDKAIAGATSLDEVFRVTMRSTV